VLTVGSGAADYRSVKYAVITTQRLDALRSPSKMFEIICAVHPRNNPPKLVSRQSALAY
jgi:hypothetical protein